MTIFFCEMAKLCLKSAKITPQNFIIIKRLVVCLVAVYRPGPYWLDSSHVKLNNFPRVQPYVCASAQAARKTGGTGRLVYLEFCKKKIISHFLCKILYQISSDTNYLIKHIHTPFIFLMTNADFQQFCNLHSPSPLFGKFWLIFFQLKPCV